MGDVVVMGKGASKSDKELASEIMAGKMKNAWEVEDRPNQPDHRPPQLRPVRGVPPTRAYRDNYDRIFRKRRGDGEG